MQDLTALEQPMNCEHPFRKTALEPQYTEYVSACSHTFLFSVSITLTYTHILLQERIKIIADPLTKINKTQKEQF